MKRTFFFRMQCALSATPGAFSQTNPSQHVPTGPANPEQKVSSVRHCYSSEIRIDDSTCLWVGVEEEEILCMICLEEQPRRQLTLQGGRGY